MQDDPTLSWPRSTRAQARRCRAGLLALSRNLVDLCPDAEMLARDPGFAERFDTTPHDHAAAAVLVAARQLLAALDEIG